MSSQEKAVAPRLPPARGSRAEVNALGRQVSLALLILGFLLLLLLMLSARAEAGTAAGWSTAGSAPAGRAG